MLIDVFCLFVVEMGSESFDKFLTLLGDTVTLQGWAGYRGGLDTKSKNTTCSVASYQHQLMVKRLEMCWFLTSLFCLWFVPSDDTTGMKSIYTVYQGHELMFHVSTMLPYSKDNKQQVCVTLYVFRKTSVMLLSHCAYSSDFVTLAPLINNDPK